MFPWLPEPQTCMPFQTLPSSSLKMMLLKPCGVYVFSERKLINVITPSGVLQYGGSLDSTILEGKKKPGTTAHGHWWKHTMTSQSHRKRWTTDRPWSHGALDTCSIWEWSVATDNCPHLIFPETSLWFKTAQTILVTEFKSSWGLWLGTSLCNS